MLARIPLDVWIAIMAAIGTVFAAVYEISAFAALYLYLALAAGVITNLINGEPGG